MTKVIATSVLASDLFSRTDGNVSSLSENTFYNRHEPSTTSIAISVGLMNLVGIWFGSVPYCHGSGGLAAQYRFGARTGLSIIFLGLLKIASALLFGSSLLPLFSLIPASIIGILLIVAGMQLASITVNLGDFKASDEKEDAYCIMILTAACLVFFANDGIGFIVGMVSVTIMGLGRDGDIRNGARKIFCLGRGVEVYH